MGLSWQQGPLSPGAIGRFLVPEPLPKRLLYAEPLRRRMRVRFGGQWIADSEHVLLLFEPGHYPMAYFPESDITPDTLESIEHTHRHSELGLTSWYTVHAGDKSAPRGAWQHIELPNYASELAGRIAFAWPAMDAFYEEDERIVGHAADSYHRIDIRQSSRQLIVIASSPIRSGRWFCTNPASRRAGMLHGPTSMNRHWPPLSIRPSARTKGCAATTMSARHIWRHGHTPKPILRSAVSRTGCRSSPISFRCRSTEAGSALSRVRP